VDLWKNCPIHFEGQIHPQTRALLLDDPALLKEEERKCRIKFQILEKKQYIADMERLAKEGQIALFKLELELINRTVTVRSMPAIRPEHLTEPEVEILAPDGDWI
jgi:hypothetical protein